MFFLLILVFPADFGKVFDRFAKLLERSDNSFR